MLRNRYVAILAIAGWFGCAGPVKVKVETIEPEPIVLGDAKVADADSDGIADDGTDQCLTAKEDGLPPTPDDGCPSTDKDGDGIVGSSDKCPNDRETVNKHQDEDGCPDDLPDVHLAEHRIWLNRPIEFTATHKVAAASKPQLEKVAALMQAHMDVQQLEVSAYYRGKESTLRSMVAQARAKAVADKLVTLGVARGRLKAKSYGNRCALSDPKSQPGASEEIQFEFWVLQRGGKTASRGPCQKADGANK